jgi:arylsulfatase A-like enzyme
MIVVGPDIPKNQKSIADVYLQDIMASVLELGDVEKPAYVEFSSFMDIARGKSSDSHYSEIYGCYTNAQRMIRKDGFKLIVYPKIEVTRLYDLTKDPLEMNDLTDDANFTAKKKELFSELLTLQKTMKDTVDLKSVFPQLVL